MRAEIDTDPVVAEPSRRRLALDRLRRWPRSFRARILVWYVGLLALATVASILVAREVLENRLDQRLDADLIQETGELERLAAGNDPETGEPFAARVRRIFDVYFERSVPSRNEAVFTFVAGEAYRRSPPDPPVLLDQVAEIAGRWARLESSERGAIGSRVGQVEYLATPLRRDGETLGVFVVAAFRDLESAASEGAFWAVGAVGLAVLLIGSVLAWRLASRVLDPVEAVAATARRISGGDLSERIPVTGRDEVARLAETLNGMFDRLESAFGAQRRFLDDAGHELRTPITIVRGHVELLGDDPQERRETTALVLDELDRMSRIVNDLLLLARYQRPDFLKLAPVELAALSDDLLAKARALGERDWRLEARATSTIVADRQRLTQAVVQLAQNAVQHTPAGSRIDLGSSVMGGEARLWVRDQGAGVPLEEQEQVFARFYRSPTGRRSEGAGLGLSIVEAIAKAHGGRVELESQPGMGALFVIVVPVRGPIRAEQGEARSR